jgi:hypothetical protein
MKPQKISENGFEKQESMQQETPEKNSGFSAILRCHCRKLWQVNCHSCCRHFSMCRNSKEFVISFIGTQIEVMGTEHT